MPLRRHSRISTHQSKGFAERQRERTQIGIAAVAVIVISGLFILSRISSSEHLSLESVQVYGADQDIVPAVQSAAFAAIQGSYLGIFPKSNAFEYPRAAVAAAVIKASPRIISAKVRRDGWHTLIVTVTEKTPAALVCADLPDFDQNGGLLDDDDCYAADPSGLIFEKMAAVASEGYGRYYVPALPDESAIGLYATSTGEFESLQSFLAGVKMAGIKPEAILMKDAGEYELYIDSPVDPASPATSSPLIVVYFNDKAGFSAELSDFTAFWSHMVSQSASGGQPPSFEYIDLRYGSNVFYRLAK